LTKTDTGKAIVRFVLEHKKLWSYPWDTRTKSIYC